MTQLPLILIIEDDPIAVSLSIEAVRESGLDAFFAAVKTPSQGLSFLRKEGPFAQAPEPELILIDLPNFGDEQLFFAIKNDSVLSNIPMIALAADPDYWISQVRHLTFIVELVKKQHDLLAFGQDLKKAIQSAIRVVQQKRLTGIRPILRRSDFKKDH